MLLSGDHASQARGFFGNVFEHFILLAVAIAIPISVLIAITNSDCDNYNFVLANYIATVM